MISDDVLTVLRSSTPDNGEVPWSEWVQKCNVIGMKALPVLLDVLREGSDTEQEQIAALFFLRALGLDGEPRNGVGKDTYYVVKLSPEAEWTDIHPRIKPKYTDEYYREEFKKARLEKARLKTES